MKLIGTHPPPGKRYSLFSNGYSHLVDALKTALKRAGMSMLKSRVLLSRSLRNSRLPKWFFVIIKGGENRVVHISFFSKPDWPIA